MGIPWCGLCASDIKPASQWWMVAGRSTLFARLKCMFSDGKQVISDRPAHCFYHKRECRPPCKASDLYVAGLPCAPHTSQRPGKSAVSAQDHPEFKVMEHYLDALRVTGSHGGIVEEVMGFMDSIRDRDWRPTERCDNKPSSWTSWFKIGLESMGYHVRVLKVRNSIWITVPRDRSLNFGRAYVRRISLIPNRDVRLPPHLTSGALPFVGREGFSQISP